MFINYSSDARKESEVREPFIKKVSHQSFMEAEGGADVSSDQGCCCRRSLEIIYKLNVENEN